jgi:hypothetical protein
MADLKTTVYPNAADYQRLRALARRQGRKTAELIREAVAEYAARRTEDSLPRSIGAGRSGRPDLSEQAEKLPQGLGQSRC